MICVPVCLCVCVCVFMCVHLHVYVCLCMCACIYVWNTHAIALKISSSNKSASIYKKLDISYKYDFFMNTVFVSYPDTVIRKKATEWLAAASADQICDYLPQLVQVCIIAVWYVFF